eukprot:s1232_g7.t1
MQDHQEGVKKEGATMRYFLECVSCTSHDLQVAMIWPTVFAQLTPSLASGEDSQCVTEESEGEESESFGHSSVHSLSDAEPNEGQEVRNRVAS